MCIYFTTQEAERQQREEEEEKTEIKKKKEVTNRGSLFTHFATTVKSLNLFSLARWNENEKKNRAINHY